MSKRTGNHAEGITMARLPGGSNHTIKKTGYKWASLAHSWPEGYNALIDLIFSKVEILIEIIFDSNCDIIWSMLFCFQSR